MWSTTLGSVWELMNAARRDAWLQLLSECANWVLLLLLLLILFVCVFSQQVWGGGGGGGVVWKRHAGHSCVSRSLASVFVLLFP